MTNKQFELHLKKIADASWQDSSIYIGKMVNDMNTKTFDEVMFSQEAWDKALAKARVKEWVESKMLVSIIYKFRDRSDDILKNSTISGLKEVILSHGLYSDVSILDHVARTSKDEAQYVAAQFCSISALRDIKDAGSAKVRKIVFQRLGPVECLDLMLSDKKADIREEGVRMAPFGYEKLNDMTKEIARGPFSMLVGKISSEFLPMLLANRNLKNRWIASKLQDRLNVEVSQNV